jgi:hypothetical protein
MKKIFAVALLVMSLASVVLADGPGTSPPPDASPNKIGVVRQMDGPGTSPPPGQ